MADTITTATPGATEKKTMGRLTALLISLAALLLGGVGGYYYGTKDKWWKWTSFETVTAGTGKSAKDAHAVLVELEGKVKDGETFAPKAPFPIPVTFEELTEQAKMGPLVTEMKKMEEGGTYKITLPAAVTKDVGEPLGGKTLVFDVKLVKVLDKAGYETEREALIAKQMQAMGISPEDMKAAEGGAAGNEAAPKAEAPAEAKPAEPAKKN